MLWIFFSLLCKQTFWFCFVLLLLLFCFVYFLQWLDCKKSLCYLQATMTLLPQLIQCYFPWTIYGQRNTEFCWQGSLDAASRVSFHIGILECRDLMSSVADCRFLNGPSVNIFCPLVADIDIGTLVQWFTDDLVSPNNKLISQHNFFFLLDV